MAPKSAKTVTSADSKLLTCKKEFDCEQWFNDLVITKGNLLALNPAVRGCYAHRPALQFAWEKIREIMDREMQKRRNLNVQNVYMPLFIRECDLEKESSFVAGFSPEMAWIEEKISDGPQEANVMGESSQEAAVSSTNCDLGVIVTDSRESVQSRASVTSVRSWLSNLLTCNRRKSGSKNNENSTIINHQNDLKRNRVGIRPTSETAFTNYFRHHINSYKDLPLCLNQWASVVRWERASKIRPLLRHREFQWQEGHTAHTTYEEADQYAYKILHYLYKKVVFEDLLGLPAIEGEKSKLETFGGAKKSYTLEVFIPESGRSIQAGTSHVLGDCFSKKSAFNARFLAQGKDNKIQITRNNFEYVKEWCTDGAIVIIEKNNVSAQFRLKTDLSKITNTLETSDFSSDSNITMSIVFEAGKGDGHEIVLGESDVLNQVDSSDKSNKSSSSTTKKIWSLDKFSNLLFSNESDFTFYLVSQHVRYPIQQTSWGISTRTLSAVVLAHGDNRGMVWPPFVAKDQIVIIKYAGGDDLDDYINHIIDELVENQGFRVLLDDSARGVSKGEKIQKYDMQGIPMWIEIGKRECEMKKLQYSLRHWSNGEEEKEIMDQKQVKKCVEIDIEEFLKEGNIQKIFENMTKEMYERVVGNVFGGGGKSNFKSDGNGKSSDGNGKCKSDVLMNKKENLSRIRIFPDAYERFRASDSQGLVDIKALQDLIVNEKCMVLVPWSESSTSEAMLMEASEQISTSQDKNLNHNAACQDQLGHKLKSVCIPINAKDFYGVLGDNKLSDVTGLKCFVTGQEAKRWALFGKTY